MGYLTRQDLLNEVNFHIKCAVVIEKIILPKAIIQVSLPGSVYSLVQAPGTWLTKCQDLSMEKIFKK